MVEASKKTGGAFYFEPLRCELQDTFSVMSNVAPDSVFSSRQGHEDNPNSISDDEAIDAEIEEIQDDETPSKKKSSKCMFILKFHTKLNSQLQQHYS